MLTRLKLYRAITCVKSWLVLLPLAWGASATAGPGSPATAWPTHGLDGVGVNVHFREPDPSGYILSPQNMPRVERQLDTIAGLGLKVVRDGVFFRWTNKDKSEYDFSDQHKFVDALDKRGLRAMVLLIYNDPRYEGELLSARTVKGRESYARFCGKIAGEFKGRGIVWEMWNEPNSSMFWNPSADVNEYMAAFKLAAAAMRKADPGCLIIAPSPAGIDLPYLKSCFEQGLLDFVSAVSVHPYARVPEQNATKLLQLDSLINRYSNQPRHDLPLVCSELGFSRLWSTWADGVYRVSTEDEQAGVVVRQVLMSVMAGVPMHIIYNINDYSNNVKEWEHNFGILRHDQTPKSSFYAIKNLLTQLAGLEFIQQLDAGDTNPQWMPLLNDYVLVFRKDNKTVIVAWTSSAPHLSVIPVLGTPTAMTDMKGKALAIPETQAPSGADQDPRFGRMMKLQLTGEPVYIFLDEKSAAKK